MDLLEILTAAAITYLMSVMSLVIFITTPKVKAK
jgi:hypothetical protein